MTMKYLRLQKAKDNVLGPSLHYKGIIGLTLGSYQV